MLSIGIRKANLANNGQTNLHIPELILQLYVFFISYFPYHFHAKAIIRTMNLNIICLFFNLVKYQRLIL
jgi:hypothetical protein